MFSISPEYILKIEKYEKNVNKIPFLRYENLNSLGLSLDLIDIQYNRKYNTYNEAASKFLIKLFNTKDIFVPCKTETCFDIQSGILTASKDILEKTRRNVAKKMIITEQLALKMSSSLSVIDTNNDDFKFLGMDCHILKYVNMDFAILAYIGKEKFDAAVSICDFGDEYKLVFNQNWENYYRILISEKDFKNAENSIQFMWHLMYGELT